MSFTGYRTRLHVGAELEYDRVHSRIPEAVAAALQDAGVLSWRIWRDGNVLFHAIETRDGRQAMVEAMQARGPIDSDWDTLIGSLVDDSPSASTELPLVWELTQSGQ